jgi:hypothetical protein
LAGSGSPPLELFSYQQQGSAPVPIHGNGLKRRRQLLPLLRAPTRDGGQKDIQGRAGVLTDGDECFRKIHY